MLALLGQTDDYYFKISGKLQEVVMDFDHTYADYVDEKGVSAIEELERETGKRILAYYAPPSAANLNEEQLSKLKALEKKLCVRLVAYNSH